MHIFRFRCALPLAIAWLAGPLLAQPISLESLLEEMVNRDGLARFPDPPYTCQQASSYDRGTVAPDQPGWFANMDRSHFVRTEERNGHQEYVMMDASGPGAVVRIWATWHGPGGKNFSDGTLRFYLDGNPQPAIEGPISRIIDGGALVSGPLSEGVSPETPYGQRGHNLYLPIPYAQHCKITYETDVLVDAGAYQGEALYYQINYRTYPAGTAVTSFEQAQLERLKSRIDTIQQQLLSSPALGPMQAETARLTGPLAAGETRTAVIDRPGAIRELSFKLEADNLPQALRSTILAIDFDGEPGVWCPVGAFFGRGYQSAPHRTFYTEVTEDGTMRTFWVMPFARECRLRLINLSDQTVEVVSGSARLGPWTWDDRSMHFQASWRQLTKIASFREGTTQPGEGAFDVNYVTVRGQGVYVGDTLAVFNGTDAWWGEGDEKIFVDGESFPSHVGTGTEDYYGYAWCRPEFFSSPFHAQPSGAGNFTPGLSVNSRYRALDAIPFERSIQFDMELWHWRNTTVNFAPAAFWYARPGARRNVAPDPKTAAEPVALKRSDVVEVFRAKNAIEGEALEIVTKTGGVTENQMLSQFRWSDDTQLWWRSGAVGDRLELEFPVAKAGRYRVMASLTKAVDYAIVDIAINNAPPVRFDRFHPNVANDLLELGVFALPAGANRLSIRIVGANDRAVKSYMFGLDYLQLLAP